MTHNKQTKRWGHLNGMINNTCGGGKDLQSLDRFVLFPFHLCLLCLGGGPDGPTRARVLAPSNYAIKNFQLYPRLVNLLLVYI
jgi:hypothetical protein